MKRYKIITGLLLLSAGIVLAQGSLTPPGAPAPSMKTLDELNESITQLSNTVEKIESRTDLATLQSSSTSYNYQIYTGGEYYLSSNLIITKNWGIYVGAPGVSIDLNGFSIICANPGNGTGIYITGSADGCSLKNGSIRGFETGIYNYANSAKLENLEVSECSQIGIYSGIGSVLKNCRALNNSATGISTGAGSTAEQCVAENNGGQGIFIVGSAINCLARNNGDGIDASSGTVLKQCIATGNQGKGISSSRGVQLINCLARNNQSNGFTIGSGSSLIACSSIGNGRDGVYSYGTVELTSCLAKSNAQNGFYLQSGSSVTHCTATRNAGQYGIFIASKGSFSSCLSSYNESATYPNSAGIYAGEGSRVQACLLRENWNTNSVQSQSLGQGIFAVNNSVVKDCLLENNKGAGINLTGTSQAIGNHCDHNGLYAEGLGAGIYATGGGNRIAENHLSQNDFGILVSSSTNLIVNNYATKNSANFDISGTQITGQIYTNSGTISTTDSFANFEF